MAVWDGATGTAGQLRETGCWSSVTQSAPIGLGAAGGSFGENEERVAELVGAGDVLVAGVRDHGSAES